MTRTIVASATREIIIGFDQPFCVIGERINPTGRKKLAAEMIAGNFDTVIKDALEQAACGATMLDVNAGVTAVDPNATEPGLLVQTLEIVQNLVDLPLSIDSSVTAAIEAALKVAKGRPLVNSVTGEEEKLEAILPLIKKYNVPVVAISNDETGISMDPDVRFAVAKKIVERCADFGIPAHDVVVDPLVMPIGALGDAGRQVFALLRRLREELKVNTTCGLSNISFGLPHRHGINAGFIPMVIGAGMTSAIMNPVPSAGDGSGARRQRAERHRRELHQLDQDLQGLQAGRRRRRPVAAPTSRSTRRAKARPMAAAAAADAKPGWRAEDRLPIAELSTERARPSTDTRSARPVHAVGQARALSGRHAGARRRAPARRLCRERVRRARHLRALPDRGAGRQFRQAQDRLLQRPHLAEGRRRKSATSACAACPSGRRLSCSAHDPRRPRHRRAAGHGHQRAGRAQGRRPTASSSATPPSSICYVEVDEPDMHKPLGDLDRLKAMLEKDWGWKDLLVAPHLIPQVQGILRKGNWGVTAAIHRDMDSSRPFIIGLWPGLKNEAYGIACDIGSTTIAMHLVSLLSGRIVASSGTSNPQIRFGEDLMSRVSYVMMNPGRPRGHDQGRARGGQRADRQGLRGRRRRPRTTFSTASSSAIRSCTTCSSASTRPNSARRRSRSPCRARCSIWAHEIDIDVNRGARLYMLPCIAGHVGADAAGATLSEGPLPPGQDDAAGRCRHQCRDRARQPQPRRRRLLADRPGLRRRRDLRPASAPRPARSSACASIPTRWSRNTASSASTNGRTRTASRKPRRRPASPASAARRSSRSSPRCICPASSPKTASSTARWPRARPRIFQNGRTFSYLLRDGEPRITVTQNDIRAIQLAKAALYAGVKLLMEKQGVEHVDTIRFAGAFGSFIDPKYAMVLGLIPDCDLAEVKAVGNAAGTGALMALLNRDHRREIEQTVEAHREDRDRAGAAFPAALHRRHGAAQQGRSVPEAGGGRHPAAAQDGQRGRRCRRSDAAPALARGTRRAPRPRLKAARRLPKFICIQMFLAL